MMMRSVVLQERTGDSDLDDILGEVFEVLLQPLEMSIVVFKRSSFPHQCSNGIQALIWEFTSNHVGGGNLVAAFQEEGKLLDHLAHVSERIVELASHQVIVQLLKDQGQSVGTLSALSLALGLHQVLLSKVWALLLHLRLVESLKHSSVYIIANVQMRICFSFFCWSSAQSFMILTKILASFAKILVQAGEQAVSQATACSSAPHARSSDGTFSDIFSRESMMASMLFWLSAESTSAQNDLDFAKQTADCTLKSDMIFCERASARRATIRRVFIIDQQSLQLAYRQQQHNQSSNSMSLGHCSLMAAMPAFNSRTFYHIQLAEVEKSSIVDTNFTILASSPTQGTGKYSLYSYMHVLPVEKSCYPTRVIFDKSGGRCGSFIFYSCALKVSMSACPYLMHWLLLRGAKRSLRVRVKKPHCLY